MSGSDVADSTDASPSALRPAGRFPELTKAMIDAGAAVVGGEEDIHARVVAMNVWYAMERARVGEVEALRESVAQVA